MTDYLFESARVRAKENALIGREGLSLLLQAKDHDALLSRLRELGVNLVTDPESGRLLREETLLLRLKKAYDEVALGDGAAVLRLWLYPYDCNNVKAAIKGFLRGIDPCSMMFDLGTVGVEQVIRMAQTGNFHGLPHAMAVAAERASDSYAKNRDPQRIDLLLDRACYADMLSAARASGNSFCLSLVQKKIDLSNIIIAVRILRMRSGEVGKLLLRDALIEGGEVSADVLIRLFGEGEEKLWGALAFGDYEMFAERVRKSDRSLGAIELAADQFFLSEVKKIKFIPYGVEVAVGYLLAAEYEVKNLRILLSGKEVGAQGETVWERMRESDV